MARREDDDFSSEPYFVSGLSSSGAQTEHVRGAPVKIHRAAAQSMGKDVTVEWVDRNSVEDWVPDARDLSDAANSQSSGFARFKEAYGDIYDNEPAYPIEQSLAPLSPSKEALVLEGSVDERKLMGRRIERDPVTRVPENFAAVDRLSESDSFFGKDKPEPETDVVLERMDRVERGRERVDYKPSKAMPIKVFRRG